MLACELAFTEGFMEYAVNSVL
uniref:Uncharacterized protein n=1 Tax=Anguilla anguilla TaxID=7936 RepID=A0A0E9PMI5_ANGAN